MKIDYDPDKNLQNVLKHHLSFEEVENLDWGDALTERDHRFDYGEDRYNAIVPCELILYTVTFTLRDGIMRVISFRRAGKRERAHYAREKY